MINFRLNIFCGTYYTMPPKRKVMRKAKKAAGYTIRTHPITGTGVKVNNKTGQMWQIDTMTGKGFWGDLWSGIKKGVGWLKDNKVVSTVAKLIPHPAAQQVGAVAGQVGFGRRPIVPFLGSTLVR